ncbi:MAG: 50S ribosomal protein L1 [Candidatus Bathyarchaeota archaeon]|nr:50S ribosomal protein L1 [Candidatus Bathyarchaeota archaeon]
MPLDQKTLLATVKEAKEKSEKRKFTQSIELILNLKEIDMKSPEGRIHEVIELPYSLEKSNKICVIASGELALKARRANADLVLERAELEGLAGKKREFRKIANDYDVFIAEAPLMPLVGRILGPVLGPRGKMPVPVPPTADIGSLIEKNRKTIVGTESMKDEEVAENIQAVLRVIEGRLKKGMKNIRCAHLKTSMGAPIKIKP